MRPLLALSTQSPRPMTSEEPSRVPAAPVHFQGVFEALVQNVVQEHARQTEYLQSEIIALQGLLGGRGGAVQDPIPKGDELGGNSPIARPKQDHGEDSETPTSRRYSTVSNGTPRRQDSDLTMGQFVSRGISMPSERKLSECIADSVATYMGLMHAPSLVTDSLVGLIDWLGSIEEPSRSGSWHWLVNSPFFHMFIATTIILNSVFIIRMADLDMKMSLGVAEYSVGDAEIRNWFAIELCFTCFYAIEWTLRLYVHRLYFFVNKDRWWNLMDTMLLAFACFELRTIADYTSRDLDLTYVRLLRLMKVVRGFKLMREFRFVREMRLMLDCVSHSAAQLFLCAVLVIYVLCMFSVIFVQVLADFLVDGGEEISNTATHDHIRESFGSVVTTMVSLYMASTGGTDWEKQYAVFHEAGTGAILLYLFFISFFLVVVWNIVMSTFVEKALQLALPDLDTMMADKHFRDARDAKEICKMIREKVDENHDGLIQVAEFAAHVEAQHFHDFLHIRGFDVKSAASFFEMLKSMSEQEDAVDVETFVACCLRLQGVATSIDLQTLRFEMKTMYYKQKSNLAKLENMVSKLAEIFVTAPAETKPSCEVQKRKPLEFGGVPCRANPTPPPKPAPRSVRAQDMEYVQVVPVLPGGTDEGVNTDDVLD